MSRKLNDHEIITFLEMNGLNVVDLTFITSGGQRHVYFGKIKEEDCVIKTIDITPLEYFGVMEIIEGSEEYYDYTEKIDFLKEVFKNEIDMNNICSSLPSPKFIFPYLVFKRGIDVFLIMIEERVSGDQLFRIFRDMKCDYDMMLDFITQMAFIIDDLFKCGLVHRDLSLSNILYDKSTDRYRVVDAGLAKNINNPRSYTATGATIGTPLFMAPEMINIQHGYRWDFRTDLYSIGIIACILRYPDLYMKLRSSQEEAIKLIIDFWQESDSSTRSIGILKNIIVKLIAPERYFRFNSISALTDAIEKIRGE